MLAGRMCFFGKDSSTLRGAGHAADPASHSPLTQESFAASSEEHGHAPTVLLIDRLCTSSAC